MLFHWCRRLKRREYTHQSVFSTSMSLISELVYIFWTDSDGLLQAQRELKENGDSTGTVELYCQYCQCKVLSSRL